VLINNYITKTYGGAKEQFQAFLTLAFGRRIVSLTPRPPYANLIVRRVGPRVGLNAVEFSVPVGSRTSTGGLCCTRPSHLGGKMTRDPPPQDRRLSHDVCLFVCFLAAAVRGGFRC
jgi:hypothetical protein